MIQELIKIYNLISDLILNHHPITLDIRYLFCQKLSGGECWNSRQEWENYIKGDCGDYTLTKFLKLLIENKRFRKDIIKVLQEESNGINISGRIRETNK